MENNEIIVQEEKSELMQSYNNDWKYATQYAKSDLVPALYKNKPENVIIAMGMSRKMDLDLFTVMQNLNIVRGKASWTGSFCKTLIELTGKFKDLDYVYVGEKGKDDYGCYLQATRVSDGKIVKGATVDTAMVKAEGWITNTKWKSMPELMFAYRASSFFARMHCPEALNGVYTSEEIEDIKKTPTEVEDILGD